jgi:SprT protein
MSHQSLLRQRQRRAGPNPLQLELPFPFAQPRDTSFAPARETQLAPTRDAPPRETEPASLREAQPAPLRDAPPASGEELRARVHDITRDLIAKARARWPRARIPEPRIEFRLRGRSAGEACAETGTTNYNLALLERNGEAFLREIVPHEVAHHVVSSRIRRRVRPHGPEWREVMDLFGAPARATHGFETEPARRVRTVPYRCGCETPHLLTLQTHRRIRRGIREYICRACRQVLVAAGKTG